ncbi:MAG: hypothetical protein SVV03_03455 [Candidatus Nanohaloarchaea archaeon]|nr:hypothetical protein [Candidatus Nanohaloarchaea archaeon]
MFPRQHAAVSGIAVLIFALWKEVALGTLVLWTVLGTVAGVLIDVDHAFLGMLVGGEFWRKARWFLHPVKAIFIKPREFAKDMYYRGFTVHRILTHTVVLLISIYLSGFWTIFKPISVAIAAHIAADVVDDIREERYRTLLRGESNEWED